MEPWTIQDAKDLYNVAGWGREYFSINPQGNVVMEAQDRPGRSSTMSCDVVCRSPC